MVNKDKAFDDINKIFDKIIEREKDKPVKNPEACHKFYFTCLNHFKKS